MHRRSFVRLLASAPLAAPLAGTLQNLSGIPALRVESNYTPAKIPGMPGPYPGRVVSVKSDNPSIPPRGGPTTRSCAR